MNYIHTVLELLSHPENQNFRWNCETWFCVEKFLEEATPQEAQALFEHMKAGRVGFSATYLNFCDLVDSQVLHRRLGEACGLLRARGFQPKTAMCADINGISMGQRDALLDNGIEFLYTNIHCHHGMYPLYQNQTAYWWEAAGGRRLLVWNGVGSTSYAVKHYREAQRRYALARRLEPPAGGEEPGPLPHCRGQPATLRRAHLGPLLHHHQPLRHHGAQPGRPQEQLRLQGPRGRLPAAGPDRRGEGGHPPLLQHQLPGTCMEYSMSDDGLAYVCPQGSALIASYDVPLFYFGEMAHHPIRLCDNREENNRRPVYSWVMNNTWETNFKMDLSGFGEYRYTLWLSGETDPQQAMEELRERCFEPWPLITG